MEKTRVILAGLWVSLMLIYLLGDVMRIFAGDFTAGEMDGKPAQPWVWVAASAVMLVPIVMIVLSLTLPHPAIRWVVIIASVGLVLFNLAGLPYDGAYDNFLIAVSLICNGVTIWYAWQWTEVAAV